MSASSSSLFYLILIPACTLVWVGCPGKKNQDPPSLCMEDAFCPNGFNPRLFDQWEPIGGIFKGIDISHDCVQGICPDAIFTFSPDSTYLILFTEVGQDSTGAFPVVTEERGRWVAYACDCREVDLPYQQKGTWETGKMRLEPEGMDAYTMAFEGFHTGMYLNTSSRDTTFNFFLKRI